jgi:hypothetical protein
MIYILKFLMGLSFTNQAHQVCMSTQFGHPGDGYGGRTPTLLHDRPVEPGDMGIAHRRWPIGSPIRIKNLETDQVSYGVVLDRGPYGKTDADGNWFNARRERERDGTYRGCADLTPDLARAIGHKGKTKVKITLLKIRK